MNKRPVVIFEQFVHKPNEQIKSQIPHLLLGACENKKTDIIKYPFNEFKEILNILRKNKLNIFPNQLPNDYLF